MPKNQKPVSAKSVVKDQRVTQLVESATDLCYAVHHLGVSKAKRKVTPLEMQIYLKNAILWRALAKIKPSKNKL